MCLLVIRPFGELVHRQSGFIIAVILVGIDVGDPQPRFGQGTGVRSISDGSKVDVDVAHAATIELVIPVPRIMMSN